MFLKFGIVTDSKPGFAKVQFPGDDNMVSDWLPVVVPFTVGDTIVWTLAVNSLVGCMMDERCRYGYIAGALYNEADTAPTANKNIFKINFADGTYVQYDKSTHELTVHSAGKITATAVGDIAATSSTGKISATSTTTIELTAPIINLKGTVNANVVNAGGMSIAAIPGISGADGKVTGDLNVTGTIQADTDVKVTGTPNVSLKTHKHTSGSAGSPTSTPIV